MKLCQFELVEEPGRVRTGIYYDNRVYETDGQNALGVHDLTHVRFHPPIAAAPLLRAFDWVRNANGDQHLTYGFLNPTQLVGPLGEIEYPVEFQGLDFDVRVCGFVQDSGKKVERSEAPGFILGYAILISPYGPAELEDELSRGAKGTLARDLPQAIGPFATTPEEVAEVSIKGEPTAFETTYEIKVNEEVVVQGAWQSGCSFADLLQVSSSASPVISGEIIGFPPLPKPALVDSPFGRDLLAGDKVSVAVQGFGTLVVRIG